jgi:lipoate-protein ligase A
MHKWRIIPCQEFSAAMNMALDETIMAGVRDKTSPPTIRFYTWNPKAITIGYFQGIHQEVDLDSCKHARVDVVRRQTGGGAVYHDDEITYSIIAPVDYFPKDIIASYGIICGHIVDALKSFGVPAKFSPINDVTIDDKKISGSAQTRRGNVLLQHGTLLYTVDVDTMFTLLTVGKEKIADKLIQSVKKRVISVHDLATHPPSREAMLNALEKTFTKDKTWEHGLYTSDELSQAEKLAEEKYSSDAWNKMR